MPAIDRRDDHTAAAQAFGALATRLTAALGRGRQALESHAGVLPEGTLADLDGLAVEFARRRVRIAIYGEVKAGKSTLLNAIAGAVLSPVAFDPLTSIPVRVTYGPRTAWHLGDRQLDSAEALERVMRNGVTDTSVTDASVTDASMTDASGTHPTGTVTGEVVIETDLDLLELGGQVDLLDTPGVGSAAQLDAVSAAALRSLDAVVLVVRYPALFTQFTRRLMESLQPDISKLFVVWNLDADCAELDPEERARHGETLRANVAGVHELFLVDARAGLRAMQADDGAGSVASGLTSFIAALRRFASSGEREVTALREAAKRSHERLGDAHRCMTERHAALERALADARTRIKTAETSAQAAAGAARVQLADFETALTRIGQQRTTTAARLAADLRQQLRSARRHWVRRGHIGALEAAIVSAVRRYADAVQAANKATGDMLRAAIDGFGSAVPDAPRARTEPAVGELAPEERSKRGTHGRWQLLRRAVWHRWYLPGLTALQGAGVTADVAAQAAWWQTASAAARAAANATLASRLAEITRHADAQIQQIKLETNFTASEAESEQIARDLPVMATEIGAVAQIAMQARALL